MRLGIVRGTIVLNLAVPALRAKRFAIVEPITTAELTAQPAKGGGKSLILVDELGAAEKEVVAFTEGREAANPYWPNPVPVDAYCALVVRSIDFRPPLNNCAAQGERQ